MNDDAKVILEVKNLDITFKMDDRNVHAIRGVDLKLRQNEILAIVGESGSGKSISAKTIMGILPDNAVINSGSVILKGDGEDTDLLTKDMDWRQANINGTKIAMVFQDPMTSLNPVMKIGNHFYTVIRSHEKISRKEAWSRGADLLKEVGITEPERTLNQYPHQLSGGMKQRIVIALALSCNPDILICDEPTTALDVTIQDRILKLIQTIQRARGLSIIFISHNLGVVSRISDYIAVMYAGRVIETGTVFDVLYDPRHPYTWGLLCSVPDSDEKSDELYTIPGAPPDLSSEIKGDPFAPRNKYALEVDFKAEPPMFRISDSHYAATWLADERAPKVEMPDDLKARIEKMRKEGADYVRRR